MSSLRHRSHRARSPASVHVNNILRKWGVTNRVQATAIIHRSGHRAS
jgi:DNA-binding NarL/FixJ family response regulator